MNYRVFFLFFYFIVTWGSEDVWSFSHSTGSVWVLLCEKQKWSSWGEYSEIVNEQNTVFSHTAIQQRQCEDAESTASQQRKSYFYLSWEFEV